MLRRQDYLLRVCDYKLDFLSKLVNPDIAVITMIGEAHIEFFGTRDKIADAKMEITHGLKEDGMLVFNGDLRIIKISRISF